MVIIFQFRTKITQVLGTYVVRYLGAYYEARSSKFNYKFGDDQAHYKPESKNPKSESQMTNFSIKTNF